MMLQSYFRSFFPVFLFLLFSFLAPGRDAQAADGPTGLAAQVASLNIGMQGYTIGTGLTAAQKNGAATNLLDDAYQGTYKFRDGELVVVVAGKDDTVLALYQRNEEGDREQARKMVSGLMGLYGEPTAMAHDKLIYWAYNSGGKISEETYNAAKEKADQLGVLATVKFSSEFTITGDSKDDSEKGTLYFIVSSDRLTEDFMQNK